MTTEPLTQVPHIPLVVDLDGTLCRTDTLHEALLALAGSNPGMLFRLPGWMGEGRAGLKARLADQGVVSPDALPLNEAVLEKVRAARAQGRPIALVSAADHRQVTAVAEAVGLFDEAFGSAEDHNLKGAAKAAFLEARYGTGQFDYIGDSKVDLPVWAVARKAITFGASLGLRRAAEAQNADIEHIENPDNRLRAMLKAMRPQQWSKNLLLFLPALAAHDPTRLGGVLLGFLAFCLTASAVYVINDLLDLSADRAHPRKRLRPFASGALSAATGVAMALGLLTGALILGLLTGNLLFLGVLGLYLIATFLYSFWLKRKLIIDILMLAGLYTVRLIAGATVAFVVLSPWLLGFSMFLFLALAAVKRLAELADQLKTGRESSGRAYEVEDLPMLRGLALSSGNTAVLVMALYISSDTVRALYADPVRLWLICPILLYWILRMVMKAHRGLLSDDPIVFAATDRVSIILIMVSGLLILTAAV